MRTRAAVILIMAAFGLAFVSLVARSPMRNVSRAELESRFASDIRNLVYRWDEADQRPSDR